MYEIEYTADRTLRRQAWQLLRQKTLLSPAGIFGILGPVFLAALGVYELRQICRGFAFWGANYLWYGDRKSVV